MGGVTLSDGNQTLTGSLAYLGLTTVNGGTLTLGDNTHSVTLPGNANVNAFGTLTLANGSLGAGVVTVAGIGTDVLIKNASDAGSAQINNSGNVAFFDTSSAKTATITNVANSFATLTFRNNSTAGNATINANAKTLTEFTDSSTAGNATVNNSGRLLFDTSASAGAAIITTTSGAAIDGKSGTFFIGAAKGGTSKQIVNAGGLLDISGSTAGGVTIGSLEGNGGKVALGANMLRVGNLNTSTTYAGVIQDAGISPGTGGGLTKIGTGTLTLSGLNTYTGETRITDGALQAGVDNALSKTSLTKVFSGATLDLNGTSQLVDQIVLVGGALKAGALTGGAIREEAGTDAAHIVIDTVNGVTGSATLTTAAFTSTTLQGTNVFSGVTNVANASIVNNGNDHRRPQQRRDLHQQRNRRTPTSPPTPGRSPTIPSRSGRAT